MPSRAASTPTDANGRPTRSRPSRAIPSANGSMRTATAATTCSRSRRATSPARARSIDRPAAAPGQRDHRQGAHPSRQGQQGHPARRGHHDRPRLHASLDGRQGLCARAQAEMVGIPLPGGDRPYLSRPRRIFGEPRRQADAGPGRISRRPTCDISSRSRSDGRAARLERVSSPHSLHRLDITRQISPSQEPLVSFWAIDFKAQIRCR